MLHAVDNNFRIFAVSDTWLAKLGYLRSEVIGRSSLDFLTEESLAYARAVVLPDFNRHGRCADIEYVMRCKDGTPIDVAWSSTLERDSSGEPRGIVTVIQDMNLPLPDGRQEAV